MAFEGDLQKFIPTPVTETETQRILRAARDIMKAKGRSQGFLQDSAGRVCVLGAIGVAAYGHAYKGMSHQGKSKEPINCFAKAARELYPAKTGNATMEIRACYLMNDRSFRTAPVMRVFERAIEIAGRR